MSYLFDGVDDDLLGQFASTYGLPLTIGCKFRWAAFRTNDLLVSLGQTETSNNNGIKIRSSATTDEYQNSVTDGAALSTSANLVDATLDDDAWHSCIAENVSTTNRSIFIDTRANVGTSGGSRDAGSSLAWIKLGERPDGTQQFAGYLAEIAIWNATLSDSEKDEYLGTTPASSIKAANLIGYWPLNASNATQANEGLDAGGDLTVNGATYDASHPTITTPSVSAAPSLFVVQGVLGWA